jgi:hypothetical protein
MIDPLEDARAAVQRGETRDLRAALHALIQHAEEQQVRLRAAESRLDRLEGANQPPSGLGQMMGGS